MQNYKPSVDAGAARRVAKVREVDSLCPYCGVGCALTYAVDQDTNDILFTRGRDGAPNAGRLCVKGRYGFDYSMHAQRLTKPLIRKETSYPRGPLSHFSKPGSSGRRKPGGIVDYDEVLPHFREASWEEALDRAAAGLKRILDTHGPEAMSGFGSAKGSNEEAYLVQKMVRAAMGTNNIDHCTRLCHASSVYALMECIGSGAVTNVVRDIENAEAALIVGCNPTANHPVAATFMKEAAARGTKLLIANIRRPELADYADQYLQMKPGTDVAFFNALMHVIIEEDLYDHEYVEKRTEGFADLAAAVKRWTPEVAAKYTGLPAEDIARFARTLGQAKSVLFFWGMGISQHTFGTDNARCLISLALITGNIGRPGTGLHPLRGQNNVQGASDVGLIPMYFPDYKSVADRETHAWYEKFWNAKLSDKPGKTVVEITTGALHGDIKAMYCMGENPFLSDPDTTKVRKALANLDFLVVQDIFLTETAEFADVILPASSFMEKHGSYTNTDRRVQIGRPARALPGQARQDWEIIC
ncbi:MAG: molybdopterin-dependent oxidoreductase, partial [Salinisphaera sp.]|nr:molybdopterin-dependent oxidoreductase [Salinisphaera sp.]